MKSQGFTHLELLVTLVAFALVAWVTLHIEHAVQSKDDVHRASPPASAASPACRNGYLMNGAKAITNKDGLVVKC